MESQATNRLVIRIKLPPQAPAPPARPPLSKLALSLVLVPVALALGWWGISMFRSEPDSQAQSAVRSPRRPRRAKPHLPSAMSRCRNLLQKYPMRRLHPSTKCFPPCRAAL